MEEVIEISNILTAADDYYKLGVELKNYSFDEGNILTGVPFITNIIFSCELYIKCIILKESHKIFCFHDLRLLLNKVSDDTRLQIINSMPNEVYNYVMQYYHDGFFDYRYAYEKEKMLNPIIKYNELIIFTNGIRQVTYKKINNHNDNMIC